MYILGVNAILGCHDGSACLIKDGKILSFVEEERFTLRRYAVGQWPHHAIQYCLREEGISIDDIDYIANGWDINKFPKTRHEYMNEDDFIKMLLPKNIFHYTKIPKVKMIQHHLAHAASALRTSGWSNAGVIVIDGVGEKESISLYKAEEGELQLIKSYPIQYSLGFFYDAVCKYVGLFHNDAGKLMGLSSYGKMLYDFHDIGIRNGEFECNIEGIDPHVNILHDAQLRNRWMESLVKQFGKQNAPQKTYYRELNMEINEMDYPQYYKDIAYSAQNLLNITIAMLVEKLISETNMKNIAYSGGVALNCVSNEYILKNTSVDELYIFPAANDAGVSVGAALETYHMISNDSKQYSLGNMSFGPKFTNNEIIKVCQQMKLKFSFVNNPEKYAADLLLSNKIIAWFNGRMECGPRALGNRSILANPMYHENIYRINRLIKNRELWRPLAPSILDEQYDNIVESKSKSPYMLFSTPLKDGVKEKMRAVTHIDGTTRPQVVSYKKNPAFWSLIKEFYKISGIPAVLNTSFNIKGDPIVCSPYEAIKAFYLSNIDVLIMENIVIKKEVI